MSGEISPQDVTALFEQTDRAHLAEIGIVDLGFILKRFLVMVVRYLGYLTKESGLQEEFSS
jgi:hypothetical protein